MITTGRLLLLNVCAFKDSAQAISKSKANTIPEHPVKRFFFVKNISEHNKQKEAKDNYSGIKVMKRSEIISHKHGKQKLYCFSSAQVRNLKSIIMSCEQDSCSVFSQLFLFDFACHFQGSAIGAKGHYQERLPVPNIEVVGIEEVAVIDIEKHAVLFPENVDSLLIKPQVNLDGNHKLS